MQKKRPVGSRTSFVGTYLPQTSPAQTFRPDTYTTCRPGASQVGQNDLRWGQNSGRTHLYKKINE